MKIVIASDSWKECMSAKEVGECITLALLPHFPGAEILNIPLADGGEGMAELIGPCCHAVKITAKAHDALMRTIEAEYYFEPERKTAIIDMSAAAGLDKIEPSLRNPLVTTTYGCGELILDAVGRGAKEIVLGLGGSATNDAGFGALQALGVRFLDKRGNEMDNPITGGSLSSIETIDRSAFSDRFRDIRISVACDVDAPFLGEKGAVRVFSPQKGADGQAMEQLEQGMKNAVRAMRRLRPDSGGFRDFPGAGAAGGMTGGFVAVAGAEVKRGISLVLDLLGFEERIAGASFIITGEGKADRQTLMWKTPYGVLKTAERQKIPVFLFAGRVEDDEALLSAGFSGVTDINRLAIGRGGNPEMNPLDPSVAKKRLALAVQESVVKFAAE